ncbi:hypothetical protein FE782_04140 [Paenibacillus antri]|uniref:Uncharacterized protein n=1 Tax=Paenibacillus antri TaxID=2582848 RepID=A0A5R9GEB2_9BACL|nr:MULTISPECIES: hypothetical protein [Paenibacillus]TLS53469.1 hypothetical protein FE782_04140 [Paenibacillus antri]
MTTELDALKRKLLRLATELATGCSFCVSVSDDPDSKAPVACTKWSGSSYPVGVNPATCLSCGEYRKSTTLT